jgi:tetratricopeptide (TPR) repeat protein
MHRRARTFFFRSAARLQFHACQLRAVDNSCIDIAPKGQENLRVDRLLKLIVTLVCAAAMSAVALAGQSNGGSSTAEVVDESSPPRVSVEIGNFYLHKKAYRGALSRFREAVRDDPDYAPAYLGLGQVYEKLGRKGEALAAYETFLDKLPSERDAQRAKGAHKAIMRLKRELASTPATPEPRATSRH